MIQPLEQEIHLDTSYLIRTLVPGSPEGAQLRAWLREGRLPAASTLAWGEFLCGPLEEGIEALAARVIRRLVPVGTEEAAEAARLFNRTGRRRGSFPDCIIAGTAIRVGAVLATSDRPDFERFVSTGLELVP